MPTVNEIASARLENVEDAIRAAKAVGIPLHVAFALLDMESEGRHIFGSDSGGMYKGQEVTKEKFEKMEAAVAAGAPSNGVGPTQVTHRSFFPQARAQGLKLWIPYDNMVFGFTLLAGYLKRYPGDYQKVGRLYNGKDSYGVTFKRVVGEWQKRLEGATEEETPVATWFLAPSLKRLQKDLDERFGEDRPNDGTIGDASHAARKSEHNPNRDSSDDVPDGAVTAMDIYTKVGSKTWISAAEFTKLLNTFKKDSRVWYVIHKGYIYSRTYNWAKRKYTGSNPHTNHIHISLRQTKAAVNSTAAWLSDPKPEPTPQPGGKYVVQSGDTLSAIAEKFGVTVDELVELNNIDNPDVISVGQVLVLDKDDEPKPAPKPETPKPALKDLPVLSRGDRDNTLVPFLKRFLFRNPPNQDGKFGKLTEREVKRYQRSQGLKVDGVVGPRTWGAIVAGGTRLPEGYTAP